MTRLSMVQALNQALHQMMATHPEMYCLGEDIGKMGGDFGVTRGLYEKFGAERVRDTPLSEAAIIGTAVGSAMVGMRPVAEIMIADFITTCYDQLVNSAAKLHYMFNGQFAAPIVVRAAAGGGFGGGPHHSQSIENWFLNVPGIVMVAPSTPYDAKGLLIASIMDNNPIIFIEHKGLYGVRGEVPEEIYTVPLGRAAIVREGRDVTVVATMKLVHEALGLADTLAKDSIELEVIDLRTLRPWDEETVFKSVAKTRRAVVLTESPLMGSLASEVSVRIFEELHHKLETPVVRVGAKDAPIPMSPILENRILPSREDINLAIRNVVTGALSKELTNG
jgi:acetoin:2,6-dichlorophenolindophenol oxidoreductase subunit beta